MQRLKALPLRYNRASSQQASRGSAGRPAEAEESHGRTRTTVTFPCDCSAAACASQAGRFFASPCGPAPMTTKVVRRRGARHRAATPFRSSEWVPIDPFYGRRRGDARRRRPSPPRRDDTPILVKMFRQAGDGLRALSRSTSR